MVILSFILLLQLSPKISHCANITVQPVSINTTLNSTVVFSCEGSGDLLSFRVNNEPATNTDVIAKGFSATSSSHNGTRRAELQAIAYEHNNNTEVKCRALTDEPLQSVLSKTAILMIQGLLASVVDLDYTFINGSSVLLTWTTPYTLDNVPITGYYIVVNGLENITTTKKSITLSTTNSDPCLINNVSVSPINDVGIGSSNNISFYYERVPLITPPVSVVPVIGRQLNISINVSKLCIGEYPNNVTVIILSTDNELQDNTSISTQFNDQLMITGIIPVPNNLNTFIVNVSLSNNGGEFLSTPSFGFGILGPVTNIDSSIVNCSTIDITWTAPTVDDRALYYILRIYDDNTAVDTVSVYDTSYQFVDNNLFIHHYTYVITGVNELGEGISNNKTFSYQRVPRSAVEHTTLDTFNYTKDTATVQYNIVVIIECTGEAPENVTVTVECNGTGVVFSNTELIEQERQPNNITGLLLVPQYQQCNISIVFSNEAGSSEPFIRTFNTTPPLPPNNSSSLSTVSVAPTIGPGSDPQSMTTGAVIGIAVGCFSAVVVLIGVLVAVLIFICYKNRYKYWGYTRTENDNNELKQKGTQMRKQGCKQKIVQ
uniref:Fibronectin type-III domain-containing protein n=1 Tax=Amphimedon queenslandica TaxID=400682 RepID=A0A1X7TU86_AMPQE